MRRVRPVAGTATGPPVSPRVGAVRKDFLPEPWILAANRSGPLDIREGNEGPSDIDILKYERIEVGAKPCGIYSRCGSLSLP